MQFFFDFCKSSCSFAAADNLVTYMISLKNKLHLKQNITYQSAKFYGIPAKEAKESSLPILLSI